MLAEPNCFKRKCRHFLGAKWLGNDETTEVVFCQAFNNGIPRVIAYGLNLHKNPFPNQGNDIVYEKETS